MRFSQKYGGRAAPTSGLAEASTTLRTAFWNEFHLALVPDDHKAIASTLKVARQLWSSFDWPTDEIPKHYWDIKKKLKDEWFGCEWPEFFDVLELAAQIVIAIERVGGEPRARRFARFNTILEAQGCAYRFVAERLAPITNESEFAAVSKAAKSPVAAVSEHITAALDFLPPNPDHSARASIKESISAVESALKHLTGEPSATLGEALKTFHKKFALDDALRRTLEQIYAYTNAPTGIRHGIVQGQPEPTLDQARLMIVVCSAFANYLVALANESHSPASTGVTPTG